MFKKILSAIKNLFSSLFGGSSNKPPVKPALPDPIEIDPQDGADIKPDTSTVIIADETDPIIIAPDETDKEFDEDVKIDPETVPTETPTETETEVEIPEPEADSTPVETEETPKHEARYLWCLDNGHGELTAGKRSPLFDDGEIRFFEYEFNRDIVKRIIKQLDEKGVKYFNVVPEVNVGNFLKERVIRANTKKSDLKKIYLSIHSNAGPAESSKHWTSDNTSGIETWFFHGSKKGQKVAGIFQNYLIDKMGWQNRHIKSKKSRQFYVLAKTSMTAVLTENGFYNNKKQAKELMKDRIRQKIADAHVEAIMEIEKEGI